MLNEDLLNSVTNHTEMSGFGQNSYFGIYLQMLSINEKYQLTLSHFPLLMDENMADLRDKLLNS